MNELRAHILYAPGLYALAGRICLFGYVKVHVGAGSRWHFNWHGGAAARSICTTEV